MFLAYFTMIRKVHYGKTFSVRFSDEVYKKLEELAKKKNYNVPTQIDGTHINNRTGITTLIRDIVESYIKNNQ